MAEQTRTANCDLRRLIVCLVTSLLLCASAAADTDLVAHYTFEEGPGDTVKGHGPNPSHGKNLGAKYVQLGAGKGYALAFDTADARVDCGKVEKLGLASAITIEFWLKPQSITTKGEAGLIGEGESIGSFMLSYTGKNCWFYIDKGNNHCRTATVLNAWQHIAATFDGKELKIYHDGQLQDSRISSSAKLNAGKKNLYLRYPVVWGDSVEPTHRCLMDDIRIYSRAMSAGEVFAAYKEGARSKGKDVGGFNQIKLAPHVYPVADILLIEAYYTAMKPLPPAASAELTVWDTQRNEAVRTATVPIIEDVEGTQYVHSSAVCSRSAVSVADKVEWRVSTEGIAPGEYEVRAVIRNERGKQVGVQIAVVITLPGKPEWLTAKPNVKVLNNLVTQLLDISTPAKQEDQQYTFIAPRRGWVYVRSTAAGEVRLTIDGATGDDTAITHAHGESEPKEAMRYLKAGRHTIRVHCSSRSALKSLVVRSIPELVFDSIGYRPGSWLKCFEPYNWDFFKESGILDNVNVIVERSPLPENAQHSRDWKAQGKKMVCASFVSWYVSKNAQFSADSFFDFVTNLRGFKQPALDGTMMSEFDNNGNPRNLSDYPLFVEALKRISLNEQFTRKQWWPCGKFMYLRPQSTDFFKAFIDAGYTFTEETYLQEQPTEKGARQYLNAFLRQRMLRYQAVAPDCQKRMIVDFAHFSIPAETVNVNPNANYKVFMDMQMNLIANDPVFSELYGVMWYHSAYADPEMHRWSAKLLRHYCIEGKRDMLSRDPYELRHIVNGDFRDGDRGWTLEPAELGTIAARNVPGLGSRQGRYPSTAKGDHALLTRRSDKGPNRFRQQIKDLQPGRLYSVKMLSTDYDDLRKGLNTKKSHAVQIRLAGVDVLTDRSIRELLSRGNGSYAKEDRKSNRWFTYQVVFFRPRTAQATLTISDWASDDSPGGLIGQQLIHNFIEIEPYLE